LESNHASGIVLADLLEANFFILVFGRSHIDLEFHVHVGYGGFVDVRPALFGNSAGGLWGSIAPSGAQAFFKGSCKTYGRRP